MASELTERRLWTPAAWLGGRWQSSVLLEADAAGRWSAITPGVAPPPETEVLAGPALPGLVDAHSHAFQRAFVGLAERRNGEHDDFWSWRDRMYGVALRITPPQLRAIAAQLYAELLAGGYTQVCEFHYLHHDEHGRRYPEPAAMAQALADAAADAGIGLTLLPVLYERAGFAQPTLRPDQRRFATTVDEVLALQRTVQAPHVTSGVAVHSLRAATPAAIAALAERSHGPLHIHAAEQIAEVEDCLKATGSRPLAWLVAHAGLDARWQLVHATHAEPAEIAGVAARGASVVLCPATEANLGDGWTDLRGWLGHGVALALGSDSQVVRAWPEELRWLEYGQRLALRQRNVAAAPGHAPSTAARLFDAVLGGGARAAGFERWGFERGARADLVEINVNDDALRGLPRGHALDGIVFAAPARPFARTLVAGRWRREDPAIGRRFEETMKTLWAGLG